MRNRVISSSKPGVDSRKFVKTVTKEISADRVTNRPSTAGLQPNSFNT